MKTARKTVQRTRPRHHGPVEAALGHLQADGYEREEALEYLLEIGARVLLLARPKEQTAKPPVLPLFPLGN